MKSIKPFLLLLLLLFITHAHIYSSPPKVTYSYTGSPQYYSLFMSLEKGIGATDYLRLIWPEQIHNTLKTEVTVNLISFSNNLQVATATCFNENVVGTTVYHVTFGYAMQPNTWYQVQVFPSKNPVTAPISYMVQVMAVSSYMASNIIYDSNLAFGYLDILATVAAPYIGSLGMIVNSTSTQNTIPTSIYSLDIYLTPTRSSSTGGNYTLFIYYDSTVGVQATGTSINDFTFMGLCQSAATVSSSAAVLLFCSISSDLSTITFAVSSVTAAQTIRISTSVSNPAYVSVRGIKGFWTESISGRVMQNGLQNNALTVTTIPINTISQRVLLFWGIESSYTDSTITTSLPLFKAGGTNIFPYNSFNVGFSFTQTSPITGQYVVTMTLGATGVPEGTIAHNLPSYNGLTVYCYYDTVGLAINCQNVGAFINTNYRYFISGKAYFSSSVTSPVTFGAVAITPIVYSNTGSLILTPSLYTPLAGVSIVLQISQQNLDISGYHNINSYSIGNAQVVSYFDDVSQTLSSTATGMQGFLQGTNSSVGVIPDLGTSQQLLFLLKTASSVITTVSNAATDFTIQLMFNNGVIGFESGVTTQGLDFVGYLSASTAWSISGSPCYYSAIVCQKYNNATPTVNTVTLVNTGATSNFYGMYNFKCGSTYTTPTGCSSNCATECNMFTGMGNTDKGSSTMAMRRITLPTGYHSPIYADTNLLDFLFIFYHGGSVASYCLINAYTVTGAKMQNIKAAYVNYFDNTAGAFNKGSRIPMMVRIGGGVLPSESNSATAIGIFFDDNVDASTFYTSTGTSWAIGCSTGSCLYTRNKGLTSTRMDNWLVNRMVLVTNLPPIQNQFNILVPVTPDMTNRSPPKILTIVFFTQNYTVYGTSGLLQTQSVYRLFGPVVTNTITGAINTINSLTRSTGGSGATPDIELGSSFTTSGSFSVALNTTNMYSNPTNNTFTYGNSDATTLNGAAFGAGYTISSFYYNIFSSSTLQWASPPLNTATTCTIFGYVYNQVATPGNIPFKHGQWMYVAFCPIDSTFSLNSAAANIEFINPQYPPVFTNGFPLRAVLTIAYSSMYGQLNAYRQQTTAISTLIRTCTTAMLQKFQPTSAGKQRSTFTLTTPVITLSNAGFTGYSSFRVVFAFPFSIVGSVLNMLSTQCATSLTTLSCTVISASSTSVTVRLGYSGTQTTTLTYVEISLYGTTSGAFSATAAAYTATVILPQYYSANSNYVPFGDINYASSSTFCSCTNSFQVGITSNGILMNFQSLTFSSTMIAARSVITFNFGASSYRDAFFSSSTYTFNFGFLANPSAAYYGVGNFRCLVYEGTNSSVMSLSSAWQTLTLSSFSSVVLSPKAEISLPNNILYSMNCYGGGVPDGNSTTAMSLSWLDAGSTVQGPATISYSGSSYISKAAFTASQSISKRFNTPGMKALYAFTVSCSSALTANSRFYFTFPMVLSQKLDNEGSVECYIRSSTLESSNQYTYCTFVTPWQLMVWNINSITASTVFYIDIFNIDQPKSADITGSQKIGLSFTSTSTYSSGNLAYVETADVSPIAGTPLDIIILTAAVDNTYILSTQTLTMTFDTQVTNIFPTNNLYVIFPSSYAQWITRAQTVPVTYPSNSSTLYCELNVTGSSVNYASSCVFVSQRILKIVVATVTDRYYSLKLMNIATPAAVPSGKYNQYSFKLFAALTAQASVTYYSFTDYSQYLTLQTNPSLIALSWNYYSLAVANSLFTLTPLTNQVITIQIGYYSNIIQLRQSIFPSNFQATMTLALTVYTTSFLYLSNTLTVSLGKQNAYFSIAANTSTSPGLYTLTFSKTGDTNSLYTNIPPLTLVVQSTLCTLTTDASTYTLPLGGSTLPITINAINCIPTQYINITTTFSGTGTGQFAKNTALSTVQLSSTTVDGRIFFIFYHTVSSLVAGNSITVNFVISGPNAAYYNPITAITLTLVDATTFQTYPTATALSAPTLSTNTANLGLQCSQASLIYWGIGIYPSILNKVSVDFQARIISGGNGLLTNFSESNDYYNQVYGIRQGSATQVIWQKLYNLQSNSNYIFKYFCVNQLGHVSDSQTINFTTLNYGAYLMSVEVTFLGSITYAQYNALACSLAQNFVIPYVRVMTEAMSSCLNTPYIFYSTNTSVILNQPDSNGQYTYGFYIEPDYTIGADTTNANIRNQLSLNSEATTIITSTANYINLPSLVQMQTFDIQIYTTPIMSISSPVSGLTSVIITAAITNMNGFIILGAMTGAFDASVYTIPSTTNIKQGIFSSNVSLLNVQMIHATQNYNTTFQFTGLAANTVYSFFYFCTVEDPSITSLSSTVKVVSATTLQMLTIDINWSPFLTAALVFFMLLLF